VASSGFYSPGRWPWNSPIASLSTFRFYSSPMFAALRFESPLGLPTRVCFDANVEQKLNQQIFLWGAWSARYEILTETRKFSRTVAIIFLRIRMDCNTWPKYTNVSAILPQADEYKIQVNYALWARVRMRNTRALLP